MSDQKAEGVDSENVVDFSNAEDSTNPLNWSKGTKWCVVLLVSLMNTVVTLSTFICASAVPQILEGLHHKSSYYSVLMVSIWDLGEALGPLVLAPSSELYGRLAALHISIVLFIISAIASAVSTNACMMIAFRFLNGVGSPYILGSAIISDIFPREQRGTAISIAGLMPLVGELFGRLIGSHTAKTLGWRWTFWIVAIIAAVLGVSLRHYMPETYAVTILEEKTMQLKKTTGNQALRSKYHKQVSAQASLRTFLRPLELLWASPMVTMLSLYLAMVNGCIYIISDTMTQVLEGTYGFSEASTRISFFGISLGIALGALLWKVTLNSYLRMRSAKGKGAPEKVLHLVVLGGLVIPAGIFICGWTAEKAVHWIGPLLGFSLIGFGKRIILISTTTYLVDATTLQAASAVTAGNSLHSIAGAVYILTQSRLHAALGLGWGSSLLGFISLAFIFVPVMFCKYGETLRKRYPVNL